MARFEVSLLFVKVFKVSIRSVIIMRAQNEAHSIWYGFLIHYPVNPLFYEFDLLRRRDIIQDDEALFVAI